MMKIAVSTENGLVSAHFGRCPAYTLIDVQGGKEISRLEIPNPGHRPGFLPGFLAEKGVDCIIAGGMGPRAQELFAQNKIEVIIGVQGPVDEAVTKFLNNELQSGQDLCDHQHGEGHQCGESSEPQGAHLMQGGKICLTAKHQSMEAEIDPRFGRAAYFLILDPFSQQVEAVKNPYLEQAHGAGIRSAQMLVEKNVKIVLTGQVGPKADQVLKAAGVQIVTNTTGTVGEAIKNLAEGIK
jgi:predicted Fe-Mo cluster-binding NifX family protein